MIRASIFIIAIAAYAATGVAAFSLASDARVAANTANVTVVHKTSTLPVFRSLAAQTCPLGVCNDGVNI